MKKFLSDIKNVKILKKMIFFCILYEILVIKVDLSLKNNFNNLKLDINKYRINLFSLLFNLFNHSVYSR